MFSILKTDYENIMIATTDGAKTVIRNGLVTVRG